MKKYLKLIPKCCKKEKINKQNKLLIYCFKSIIITIVEFDFFLLNIINFIMKLVIMYITIIKFKKL